MPELAPNTPLGPYTIVKPLPSGRGGMARVYLAAWQPPDGRPVAQVAIKVANTATDSAGSREMTAEQLEGFYFRALNREVETLKKLRHPSIVRIYPIPWGIKKDPYIARATEIRGAPWFCAMEYLKGNSLKQLIDQHKRLEPRLAVEIAYQIASALDYMHSQEYAHLDVKPENILFRTLLQRQEQPEAVIIDFGIAQRERQGPPEGGTLIYTPPERLKVMLGQTPPERAGANPPVDVYAVGVLLHTMLTGQLPFNGRTRSSLTSAILYSNPTQPSKIAPDVSHPLDALVARTLSKEPEERPSAHELVMLLDEAIPPPRFAADLNGARLERVSPAVITTSRARPWKVSTGVFAALAALELGLLLSLTGPNLPWPPFDAATPTQPPTVRPTAPPTKAPVIAPTAAPTTAPSATPEDTATPGEAPAAAAAEAEATATLRPMSSPLPTRTPMPTITPVPPTSPPTPTPAPTQAPS